MSEAKEITKEELEKLNDKLKVEMAPKVTIDPEEKQIKLGIEIKW